LKFLNVDVLEPQNGPLLILNKRRIRKNFVEKR
jgi:hypothetical protein